MPFIMLHNYLEQLCDAFRDGICISDRAGVVHLVNRRHGELTGVDRHAIVGRLVTEMVDEGAFDVVLNPLVVRGKSPVTRVQTLPNGRRLVLEGKPLFDAQGGVAYVVTFIRDETTLAELREQVASQKSLLETFQQMNSSSSFKQLRYPTVVQSQSMRSLYAESAAIAETDATVLLLGETGVGKDVVARRIHATSPRAEKAFIKVDCGSIPENLIETELFGYAAGSFSGASKHGKAGLIEAAHEGTLFLDEIGELPMTMQSRLLRVLQDWEVMRVGATTPRSVDVRIVAATNKDLEQEVRRGGFRSDLYYRLKVAVLRIPSLRQRHGDVLPLARSFLEYYAHKYHKKACFSAEAEQALLAYHWPGNVRELENLILGLVVTSKKEEIEAGDLPLSLQGRLGGPSQVEVTPVDVEGRSYKEIMKDLENMVLRTAMHRYGSISEVARHFQVDRSTIFRKVKEMEKEQQRLAGQEA